MMAQLDHQAHLSLAERQGLDAGEFVCNAVQRAYQQFIDAGAMRIFGCIGMALRVAALIGDQVPGETLNDLR